MSLNQNLQNYLNTNNSTLDKYIISTFYKFLVLENYQESDGSVTIPDALRSYIGKESILKP